MKESKLYLRFFKSNLIFFLISACLFSIIGGVIQLEKPSKFETVRLLQIQGTGSVQDQIAHVQETVSLVRSVNIQHHLGLASQLVIYNSSPLNVTIQVLSGDWITTRIDTEKITQFMQSEYMYKSLGDDVSNEVRPNILLGVFVGFIIGNVLTVIALLSFHYFCKY